jgi:hypothetical protein
MTFPFNPQHHYYQPIGSGDSITIPASRYVLVLDPPGGNFSGFTLTMPPNPMDNQLLFVTATATISGVILHAQPGQNLGANTSLTTISPTGAGQTFVYRGANSTWYQMP